LQHGCSSKIAAEEAADGGFGSYYARRQRQVSDPRGRAGAAERVIDKFRLCGGTAALAQQILDGRPEQPLPGW